MRTARSSFKPKAIVETKPNVQTLAEAEAEAATGSPVKRERAGER